MYIYFTVFNTEVCVSQYLAIGIQDCHVFFFKKTINFITVSSDAAVLYTVQTKT